MNTALKKFLINCKFLASLFRMSDDTTPLTLTNNFSEEWIANAIQEYVDGLMEYTEQEDRVSVEDELVTRLKKLDSKKRFDLRKKQPILGAILFTCINTGTDVEEKMRRLYDTMERVFHDVDYMHEKSYDKMNVVSEQVDLLLEEAEVIKSKIGKIESRMLTMTQTMIETHRMQQECHYMLKTCIKNWKNEGFILKENS